MIRSFYKPVFVRSLQRLIPEVQAGDLIPIHAGIRTQTLVNDGKLVDNFLIVKDQIRNFELLTSSLLCFKSIML